MIQLENLVKVTILCFILIGCYDSIQKPTDMNQVRRQFHLPDKAVFSFFDSSPKSLRPEGLRIVATVQFSDVTFDEYVKQLNDRSVWEPVRLLSYSPAIGGQYSKAALRWNDLPMSTSLAQQLNNWRIVSPDMANVTHGKYFCSVIATRRGEPLKHNANAYNWMNLGLACSELETGEWPTITMLGVLDPQEKHLHVVIQFSG